MVDLPRRGVVAAVAGTLMLGVALVGCGPSSPQAATTPAPSLDDIRSVFYGFGPPGEALMAVVGELHGRGGGYGFEMTASADEGTAEVSLVAGEGTAAPGEARCYEYELDPTSQQAELIRVSEGTCGAT